MKLIENYVARAEQLLNCADWIPFVSSFSGMVRILASSVQLAASIAFTMLAAMLTNNWSDAGEQGFIYCIHALGNTLRGALAMLPGLGNALLFAHDWKLGRMNYPEEVLVKKVYPLMTCRVMIHGV